MATTSVHLHNDGASAPLTGSQHYWDILAGIWSIACEAELEKKRKKKKKDRVRLIG